MKHALLYFFFQIERIYNGKNNFNYILKFAKLSRNTSFLCSLARCRNRLACAEGEQGRVDELSTDTCTVVLTAFC